MSRRSIILILALAFVVGIAFTAYAEVQNVKVSGDITVQGVARDNFDLTKGMKRFVNTSDFNDKDRDFLSITRVRVDADLTDNVMATVRLLNERNWDGDSNTAGNMSNATANRNIGMNTATVAGGRTGNEVDIDLAYVALREFLYSPLSLTVGRQELHIGNELIVGDPDTNNFSALTDLAEGDLSKRKAFDAIRATLDYNPLVLDVLYAKVTEGSANLNDDVTLGGFNASYALNNNTTLEGFFFNKLKGVNANAVFNVDAQDNTTLTGRIIKDKSDIVNTVGFRVTDKTLKNLSLEGSAAFQFGRYNPKFDPNARVDSDVSRNARTTQRRAWAAQLAAAYDLKDVAMLSSYSPVIRGFYTYLSGADRDAGGANRPSDKNRKYTGWDPMFENQTEGHIINAIFANTNMHRAGLSAKAKLTDDISANLDYVGAWFARTAPKGANRVSVISGVAGTTLATSGREFMVTGKSYIGSELDATLTYDYTEDVQFSLLGGVLFSADAVRNQDTGGNSKSDNAAATELIGSMKVTF